MHLPITALYGSLCGLLIILLAIRVVSQRRKLGVGIGTGEQKILERAIRVHSNAVEYIPIALLLLALCEANGGYIYLLHGMGMILVIARALHAQGLGSSAGTSFGRLWGTALTWLVIVIASIANLVIFFI